MIPRPTRPAGGIEMQAVETAPDSTVTMPIATFESMETDLNAALDGWTRTATELSNVRDENLWYRMACTGLMRIAERGPMNRQEQQFLARVKEGPNGSLRRWDDEEENESMNETER